MIDVPALPQPDVDVFQDSEGFSAELTVERDLDIREIDAFREACIRLMPVVSVDGQSQERGLVSVDDDTLWVYVHAIGPGRYDSVRESAARDLLAHLWTVIHEAAAAY